MAVSTIPAQTATNALQAIPFGSMIGGPLKACIEAQAMAAKTTWEFIKEVGLYTDDKTGEKVAVNVAFSFIQGGHLVQINVPLLTIVPIPYIAVHSIDINFKANVSASSSSFNETSSSDTLGIGGEGKANIGFGPFKAELSLKANYSSKKDSKATEESKYSVESTIDVAVKAGQDSMPAGLAKVLEMLGNSLDVCDVNGVLEASALELPITDKLYLTYKDKNGLFMPDEIKPVKSDGVTDKTVGDSKEYAFAVAGEYKFKAGDREITITVTPSKDAFKENPKEQQQKDSTKEQASKDPTKDQQPKK